jgi:two-component system, LytTR family, response regulator
MYCIASANYTHIHTRDKVFLSSRNLKDFQEMLPAAMFCRIHHGHIVNINFIAKLQKGRDGSVIMQDGKEMEIAIRRKEEFLKRFDL